MDKQEIRTAIRRHWGIALVAFVLSLLLGAAMDLVPKTTYTATATVSVQPSAASGVSGVNNAVFLIPSYVQVISTEHMHALVRSSVPASDRTAPIVLSAKNLTGTGLIQVSATGPRPKAAASWATAAASRLVADGNSGQGLLSFSLLQPAAVPSSPTFPKPIPIALGSIVLGLILAPMSAVAMLRLRAAPTQDEARRRFGIPLLSSLPRSASVPDDEPVLRWLHNAADEAFAEALRQLRTNMELATGPAIRSIGISSAVTAEGKSLTAASLAWSMAAVGVKTCLVDADLRQPELHGLLGQPARPGLGDAVTEGRAMKQRTALANLAFVSAGKRTGHPADVLAMTLPPTLASLQEEGYFVVVDTPGVEESPEAEWILASLDAVVLVVDRKAMRRTRPDKTLQRLRASGSNVVGLVVNRASRRGPARLHGLSAERFGAEGSPVARADGAQVAGVRG